MIKYDEDAWCEHCGNLEPYEPTHYDGNTYWCMDCAFANSDVTEKQQIEYWAKGNQYKIKYFKRRIKELEKEATDKEL